MEAVTATTAAAVKLPEKRLFIAITGRNFANKTQKSAFFIKKNDYKCMKIEINCTGSDTIQLHELTEFQGFTDRTRAEMVRRN